MTFEIPMAGWVFAACFIVFVGAMGFYWGRIEDAEQRDKGQADSAE
jgi:hypothetical protein